MFIISNVIILYYDGLLLVKRPKQISHPAFLIRQRGV